MADPNKPPKPAASGSPQQQNVLQQFEERLRGAGVSDNVVKQEMSKINEMPLWVLLDLSKDHQTEQRLSKKEDQHYRLTMFIVTCTTLVVLVGLVLCFSMTPPEGRGEISKLVIQLLAGAATGGGLTFALGKRSKSFADIRPTKEPGS